MIKKIINLTTWVIFIFGFALTGIVAIAQSSVPGDATYGVKTGFEKVVLASYSLVHKDTDYQIDLTKVRFKESQQMIKSDQSSTSLANLNLQILSTEDNITNIQDTKSKSNYAKKYISTLKEIKTQLDYEKETIIVSSSTDTSISVSTTTTTTDSTTTESVTDQIDETRTQIDETINNLTEEIPVESEQTTDANVNYTPTPIPTINNTDTSRVEGPTPVDNMGSGPTPNVHSAEDVDEPTPSPTPTISPTVTPTTTPTPTIPAKN